VREISTETIIKAVRDLCINANYHLGEDVLTVIKEAQSNEPSPMGRSVLEELEENARIATEEEFPICQDCGYAVLFVELGQEASIVGGDLNEAINEGVRQGYEDGVLRKSICDPFTHKNTGDNTPAVIPAMG